MARRSAPADCHCRMAAALAPAAMSYGESYDYAGSAPVAGYAYGGGWTVAPQGYVPPLGVPPVPPYDGPADLPPYAPMPYAPMSYAPAPYGAPPAYAEGYGDGYACGYQTGITVEQGGWIGGVGYERSGGGGCCGGGGGLSLTLSQPDSLNGPSYNSFGQSYGGDYQSAAQVNQWRAQALAPHSNSGSGSGSGSGGH
ncbi:MAG: hypothetical protein JO256_02390 [Alphaproteobacteria bacterium]|nr:hypothetical protein [Alphaproteobacteria bacterium]